jgi:DNA mismatch repair protein MutS
VPPAVVARARAVLERLETDKAAHVRLDDLPLFALMEPPPPPMKSALVEAVEALDPDALSPREALEALYRLKALSK